jgi:hypothetical protein
MRLAILIIFLILSVSCESQSGKRVQQDSTSVPVKAVVLSSQIQFESYLYRIKIIDKGVVAYCKSEYIYMEGDTIMVKPLTIKY